MINFSPLKKEANLSQLQRCIIALGKQNGGTVLARDVLIHYYGFQPSRDPTSIRRGALIFKKSDIDNYNSATVAVCKAFDRLVMRGLATRVFSGIQLNVDNIDG